MVPFIISDAKIGTRTARIPSQNRRSVGFAVTDDAAIGVGVPTHGMRRGKAHRGLILEFDGVICVDGRLLSSLAKMVEGG